MIIEKGQFWMVKSVEGVSDADIKEGDSIAIIHVVVSVCPQCLPILVMMTSEGVTKVGKVNTRNFWRDFEYIGEL